METTEFEHWRMGKLRFRNISGTSSMFSREDEFVVELDSSWFILVLINFAKPNNNIFLFFNICCFINILRRNLRLVLGDSLERLLFFLGVGMHLVSLLFLFLFKLKELDAASMEVNLQVCVEQVTMRHPASSLTFLTCPRLLWLLPHNSKYYSMTFALCWRLLLESHALLVDGKSLSYRCLFELKKKDAGGSSKEVVVM